MSRWRNEEPVEPSRCQNNSLTIVQTNAIESMTQSLEQLSLPSYSVGSFKEFGLPKFGSKRSDRFQTKC
jgi:hypothetical protein